jgi:NACalpha-BTF3-like transcription factor
MEAEARPAIRMTTREIRAIEEIIHRRNQAEIKIEQGKIAVIEIKRKKVN